MAGEASKLRGQICCKELSITQQLLWGVIKIEKKNKNKKKFEANQPDLISSKLNSDSKAGILSSTGGIQLSWLQKHPELEVQATLRFPLLLVSSQTALSMNS